MPHYLVTGGAGFIGSNLVRALITSGSSVIVIDNLSTGHLENLSDIAAQITFVHEDISNISAISPLFKNIDVCFHLAALPSVPRSIADPLLCNQVNVHGTLSVFLAARDAGVRRVVFASSSSVYGLASISPVNETLPRLPISPYGVSKAVGEMYAAVFSSLYDMDLVGLRFFNVFGPYQNPASQYAAVIPRFIARMSRNQRPIIFGDGHQARDFTFVDNVVKANILAATNPNRISACYNVGCGVSTSVLRIVDLLNEILGTNTKPDFQPARPGDIHDSCADISAAEKSFSYAPHVDVFEGLRRTVDWFQTKGIPHYENAQ